MVFIAYLSHSPEDTAIGLGATDEEAIAALIAAYPAAQRKAIEVTTCEIGRGVSSLENAPLICRTSR